MAAACPSPPLSRALVLHEVLSAALCASPEAQGAAWQVRVQRALADLERSGGLPQAEAVLGMGSGTDRLTVDGETATGRRGTRSWAWALRWELWDFGQREARVETARYLVRGAIDSGDAVAQEVLLAAGTAYFELVQAEGLAQQLGQSAANSRNLLRQALSLRGDRKLDRLGELQARTDLARVQLELVRAEATVEVARAELARQLGLPPQAPVQVVPLGDLPSPELPTTDAEVESLIVDAMQQNPELLAARARVQSQSAQLEVARRLNRPTLSLSAGQSRARDPFGQRQQGQSIGLELTVPLVDGGSRRAQSAQASAELGNRQAELKSIERATALAVWTAHQALKSSGRALEQARQMQLVARELLDAETAAFLAGNSDMFDVLDARSSYDEAATEVLITRTEMELARLRLAAALGRLR